MNRVSLKYLINEEIMRLSVSHDKETIFLINNVLRPMVAYIDDHNRLVAEISRISSKHIT
jgi:hypothetical protein